MSKEVIKKKHAAQNVIAWETRIWQSSVDVVICRDSGYACVCTHQFVTHRQLLLKKLDFFL